MFSEWPQFLFSKFQGLVRDARCHAYIYIYTHIYMTLAREPKQSFWELEAEEERKKGRKEERKKIRTQERQKGRKEERKKGRKEERKKGRKEGRKKGSLRLRRHLGGIWDASGVWSRNVSKPLCFTAFY